MFSMRHLRLLLFLSACLFLTPRSVSMAQEPAPCFRSARPVSAAPPEPAGPGRGGRKAWHRVVACTSLILGVSGVFLAFATGPLVPWALWAVAGFALQICGG